MTGNTDWQQTGWYASYCECILVYICAELWSRLADLTGQRGIICIWYQSHRSTPSLSLPVEETLRLWTCRCCRLTHQRQASQGADTLLRVVSCLGRNLWSWTVFCSPGSMSICPYHKDRSISLADLGSRSLCPLQIQYPKIVSVCYTMYYCFYRPQKLARLCVSYMCLWFWCPWQWSAPQHTLKSWIPAPAAFGDRGGVISQSCLEVLQAPREETRPTPGQN